MYFILCCVMAHPIRNKVLLFPTPKKTMFCYFPRQRKQCFVIAHAKENYVSLFPMPNKTKFRYKRNKCTNFIFSKHKIENRLINLTSFDEKRRLVYCEIFFLNILYDNLMVDSNFAPLVPN